MGWPEIKHVNAKRDTSFTDQKALLSQSILIEEWKRNFAMNVRVTVSNSSVNVARMPFMKSRTFLQ